MDPIYEYRKGEGWVCSSPVIATNRDGKSYLLIPGVPKEKGQLYRCRTFGYGWENPDGTTNLQVVKSIIEDGWDSDFGINNLPEQREPSLYNYVTCIPV